VPSDLSLALELADLADAITLPRFRAADLVVETNPDLTPVSEADRAVERAIRERLAAERPGDAVLGEEEGGDGDGAASSRWILDPIDATRNYVRGIPVFATLIALERDGATAAAVVSAPALGRRWWASRDEGAFADDGRQLHVSRVGRIEDAVLTYTSAADFFRAGLGEAFERLASTAWAPRGYGVFWQYMLLAEGSVDVAIETAAELWDLAAPQLIVEEAGGRFTDFAGTRTAAGGTCVASNGLLHQAALDALSR
jgi:histidinol-phosphatase